MRAALLGRQPGGNSGRNTRHRQGRAFARSTPLPLTVDQAGPDQHQRRESQCVQRGFEGSPFTRL